jgi:hypothetical protein
VLGQQIGGRPSQPTTEDLGARKPGTLCGLVEE